MIHSAPSSARSPFSSSTDRTLPPDPIARLEHDHREPVVVQVERGRQPGEPGPDDHDVRVGHEPMLGCDGEPLCYSETFAPPVQSPPRRGGESMAHPRERRAGACRRGVPAKTSLGAAAVLPGASAILAACAKPGVDAPAGSRDADPGAPGSARSPCRCSGIRSRRTRRSSREPLRVYNWDDYFYKRVLKEFEDEYGVTVEWTTFNNMEEGIQKLVAGQVQADVFFPTTDYVARLVERDLLQPLNHELDPEPPGELLAFVLRPRAVLRPRVAIHDPVRDLHDRASPTGGTGSTTPRRPPPGTSSCSIPEFNGRGELLRLLPRRARDDAAPQRRDGREHGRRGRDRRGEGRDPADDQRQRRAADDQRRRTRSCPRASSPSRRPGRATSSARSSTSPRDPGTSSATGTRPTSAGWSATTRS